MSKMLGGIIGFGLLLIVGGLLVASGTAGSLATTTRMTASGVIRASYMVSVLIVTGLKTIHGSQGLKQRARAVLGEMKPVLSSAANLMVQYGFNNSSSMITFVGLVSPADPQGRKLIDYVRLDPMGKRALAKVGLTEAQANAMLWQVIVKLAKQIIPRVAQESPAKIRKGIAFIERAASELSAISLRDPNLTGPIVFLGRNIPSAQQIKSLIQRNGVVPQSLDEVDIDDVANSLVLASDPYQYETSLPPMTGGYDGVEPGYSDPLLDASWDSMSAMDDLYPDDDFDTTYALTPAGYIPVTVRRPRRQRLTNDPRVYAWRRY
jgi:hypothetical protein